MKISIFGSSIRPWLWLEFCDSLLSNTIPFEVVFGGTLTSFQVRPFLNKYPFLKYIHTEDIPPAQIYEATRRRCVGELIHWSCDDGFYDPGLLDSVYDYFKSFNDYKAMISIKTNENNSNNDLDDHRLIGGDRTMPIMCPLGLLEKKFLDELGGYDRRFLCGQGENDIVVRGLCAGGHTYKYEEKRIHIEHLKKHGPGTKFWTGYNWDRKVLEDTWIKGGYVNPIAVEGFLIRFNEGKAYDYTLPQNVRFFSKTPQLPFEPYSDENITSISQCPHRWPV